MDYCNVIKTEKINGVVTHSVIGYINIADKVSFETTHSTNIADWARSNPTIALEDYFNVVTVCYLLDSVSTAQGNLITNFQTPE